MQGKPSLEDGFAITPNILETARQKYAKIQVRRGDFLLVRTGHIEAKLNSKNWDGYAGGDAPGLSFETLDWLQKRQVAAVATDTWSVEVRPNNSDEVVSPFHWISIPIMGLTLGEIFNLAELGRDGARMMGDANFCLWRRFCLSRAPSRLRLIPWL